MIQRPHIPQQLPLPRLTPNRIINGIERILHHIIGIQLVDIPNDTVDIRLQRLREEQELGARERLEALQPEVLRLEHLDARGRGRAVREGWRGERYGVKARGESVYAARC